MSYAGDGPIYIHNNTFYNNTKNDIISYVTNPAVYVRNNIFSSSNRALSVSNTSNWSVDYNCYYNTTAGSPSGSHSITSNPYFNNAGSGNFTLASNSPCINRGTNLGSTYDDALNPSSSWPSIPG